jgi:hypothetical protein
MSLTPETGVLEKIDFWCKQNKYSLSPEEHGVTRDCMLRTIKYGAAGSLIGGIGFAALSRGRMMETKRMMWTIGSFGAGVLGWELGKMFAMRPNMRQMLSVSQSIIAQVTKEMYVRPDLYVTLLYSMPRPETHSPRILATHFPRV